MYTILSTINTQVMYIHQCDRIARGQKQFIKTNVIFLQKI